jgi:hypothetical protein
MTAAAQYRDLSRQFLDLQATDPSDTLFYAMLEKLDDLWTEMSEADREKERQAAALRLKVA